MEYKYAVGDYVRIVASGSGCSHTVIGKIVMISKLGAYCGKPGYEIDNKSLNTNSKASPQFDGFNGEYSFELVLKGSNVKYIKALKDYPDGGIVLKGDIGRVTSLNTNGLPSLVDFQKHSNYHINKDTYLTFGNYIACDENGFEITSPDYGKQKPKLDKSSGYKPHHFFKIGEKYYNVETKSYAYYAGNTSVGHVFETISDNGVENITNILPNYKPKGNGKYWRYGGLEEQFRKIHEPTDIKDKSNIRYVRVIKDIDSKNIPTWNVNKGFILIEKDTITWIKKDNLPLEKKSTVILESNQYGCNIPSEYFELIDEYALIPEECVPTISGSKVKEIKSEQEALKKTEEFWQEEILVKELPLVYTPLPDLKQKESLKKLDSKVISTNFKLPDIEQKRTKFIF